MSEIKLLSLSGQENEEWAEIIESFPYSCQDVYFTPAYAGLEESVQAGRSVCFYYSEGDKKGIHTFFLRPVFETGYFDAESYYGYGGPLINNNCALFRSRFEQGWLDYCRQNGIIAEFLRFHTLLKNQYVFEKDIKVVKNRTTVFVDLNEGDLWNESISSKNRNMIRKAERLGVRIEKLDAGDGIPQFKEIYRVTMDYLGADDYFYFSERYFEKIKSLEDNLIILMAVLEDKVIAASLFLKWKSYFHYHLSGSLPEYRNLAPTNLLLWEAVKMAQSLGCRIMHLGGGRTGSPEDTLFKFKSSFSKRKSDFYIGMRVHNNSVYNCLIDKWKKDNPGKKQELFLQYRF